VISFVPEATQKEAMAFLQQQVFNTPTWLLDKQLYAKVGVGAPSTITNLQGSALGRLLSPGTLEKLIQFETFDPAKAYTATEMLNDLKAGIWSEVKNRSAINIYRRNLQKAYVERLVALLAPPPQAAPQMPGMQAQGISKTSDALSILKGHARSLRSEIRAALPSMKDNASRLHLADLEERLEDALENDK
jgi:hypothetical protein